MSDSDENITHVFDQTNGVLDGFEGESDGTSEGAVTSAAERRGDASADRAPAEQPTGGLGDDAPPVQARADGDAARDEEHTYAVDSRGTATDTDADADGARTASTSGGAHVATAADTEPAEVQRSEAADPPVTHDHADHDHDHDHADHDHAAAGAPVGGTTGLGALAGDDSIAHVFDQTNGVVEGVEGESDGTVDGDEASSADRHGLNEPNPVGQQDAWHDDHYGADDGRDPNP